MNRSPTPKAFFSYVRHVDEHDVGRLTRLRARLQGEIRAQTGLAFEIFQDVGDLKWGDKWRERLQDALAGSLFLIPVVTPGYFQSDPCRQEYEAFKTFQSSRKIEGAILPIYYIETDELSDPAWRAGNAWAEDLAAGQWADWRTLRLEPWETTEPSRRVEQMAKAFKARLKDMGVLRPAPVGVPPPPAPRERKDALPPAQTSGTTVQVIAASTNVRASSEAPTAMVPRREVVVDATGAGSFRTVSDAVNAARADDVILIRPGTYRESVQIGKSITLLGDGPRELIVIEANSGQVISFDAAFGRVANLTIRRLQDDPAGTPGDAVSLSTGRVEIDGCDITSESLCCVVIHGDADPAVRRNRIHDAAVAGIYVHERGRGTIEDNDIFANAFAGIEITDGADPTVRRNRVHDGKACGVWIHQKGRGTIEDNDIFANAFAGIEIRDAGDPTVRRNRVHDGKEGGVVILQKGRGTIEDNDIFANAFAGILIRKRADTTVRRNRINKNGYEGIWVCEDGRGTFEDNDLRDNRRGAWDVAADCLPNVKRSGNVEK